MESCTLASASATCGEWASGSVYTATVPTPRRRQVAKTRRAISARLATRTLLISSLSSSRKRPRLHPENTEVAGALDRRIGDGGQAYSEQRASVPRVDHAVVVEPSRQKHR